MSDDSGVVVCNGEDDSRQLPKLLLSRREAAKAIGISVGLLDQRVKEGRIRRVKEGRRVLFAERDLTDYVETLRAKSEDVA